MSQAKSQSSFNVPSPYKELNSKMDIIKESTLKHNRNKTFKIFD